MNVPLHTPSPGSESVSGTPWQRDLESAFGSFLAAFQKLAELDETALDVHFTAEQLKSSLEHVFVAHRRDEDPAFVLPHGLAALDRASAAVTTARLLDPGLTSLEADLDEARRGVALAEEYVRSQLFSGAPPDEPLLASHGRSRLHPRVRPVLALSLTLDPLPPLPPEPEAPPALPVTTPEELAAAVAALRARVEARKAEPPPPKKEPHDTESASAPPPLPALSPDEFRLAQARECLVELAMLLTHRTPQRGENWRGASVFEARICANVDAIVALGRAPLPQLAAQVLDSPAPDPALLSAFALLMGSIDGRDSLAWAEWVYLRSEPSPELDDAFAGALALSLHPALPALCDRWLRGELPSRRALALRLWGRIGEVPPERLLSALGDEPQVRAAALPLYARHYPLDLREHVDEAVAAGDPELLRAAWKAQLVGGDARSSSFLHAGLSGSERDAAALLLSVSAERRDAEELLAHAQQAPSPALLQALGFAGWVRAVPFLIACLRADDFDTQIAAASALMRLTGWELWEEVELPPDQATGVPEPEEDEPSLAETVSNPRDAAPPPSPDTVLLPTLRAEVWQTHWDQGGGAFNETLRYRRGRPSSTEVLLDELDFSRATPEERALIALELGVRCGRPLTFDPWTWVTTQSAQLELWRATLPNGQAGAWLSPRRLTHH